MSRYKVPMSWRKAKLLKAARWLVTQPINDATDFIRCAVLWGWTDMIDERDLR